MNIYKYLWFFGTKPKDSTVTLLPSGKSVHVAKNTTLLSAALDQLEATLNSPLGNMKGDYAVGQYTLADCAWAGVCQVATNMGKGNAVSSRAKVNSWFAAVQSHPSTSKEAINPFSCMATKVDHDGNTMREVRINTA